MKSYLLILKALENPEDKALADLHLPVMNENSPKTAGDFNVL